MITEVYINDNLIDIEDEATVAASYGSITFGEFQKRKGVKTNTWQAPFSPRNKDVFESCEVPGSDSLIPYRKGSIRVEIHGVIVFEGFCIMDEAKTSYQILSFAGASDFYNSINKKKLTDLDLSEFDHLWNEVTQRISWANTKGHIYAYVFNGRPEGIPDELPPDFLLPHVFFHTVIKQIATDEGYTLLGDVLTNERFLNHIIICNKFPLPIIYGGEFILSQTLPNVTQSKLWLDFANIYGLQFDIDDKNKTIRANYIDDIIFNEPEVWTDKIDRSEKRSTKYSLGYGQKSYLRFTSDEVCTNDYAKEIIVDDHTLSLEEDVYKSSFFLIQFYAPGTFMNGIAATFTYTRKEAFRFLGAWKNDVGYGPGGLNIVWHNGTFYQAIANNTNQQPPNATYWKVVPEGDVWTIKSRAMYGYLVTEPSSPVNVIFSTGNEQVRKIISSVNLDWNTSYDLHYEVFNRIINKTKKVEELVKLSYADINQLDFTKAKRIDNELYVLENVVQFKLNKKDSTICELIRL